MSSRLLHGAPSAPSETETPRSSIDATGATPEPSFMFDEGQCETCVPAPASKFISRSLTCTQCASRTCGPETPTESRYSTLRRPVSRMTISHSENRSECEMVMRETGLRNVEYLDSVGVSGPHVLLAHCVHVSEREINLLAGAGTHVSHCPSSNMKLGSGVAPVASMLERGVSV